MKQGLLMNQILSTYALDNVEDSLCKNHTNRFKNGLRAFEPWALKMFDSSSKIQPGVLLGNLVEFGSFRQCIQTTFEEITDLDLIKKILSFRNITPRRFTKVRIIVEKSALYWSVCVPASCGVMDIFRHFNKVVGEMTEGLNLNVTLDENHCLTSENSPRMGLLQYFAMYDQIESLLLILIIMSLTSTAIDYATSNKALPQNKILQAFSICTNYRKITARKTKNELDCLHGLRFLSVSYVVIGHRYLMAMYFPVINGLEILDWILNYTSTIIIGGTICVDTFFLISGMLVSIGFFDHVTKTGSFNLITFYLYRYFRITTPLAVAVLLYATLIEFLGSGPLWHDTCMAHLEPCKYYWWSTLLHVQSYVNPGFLCILQTWYLTCDMVFYYFSPLILYPLWKYRIIGLINYSFVYILSLAISFYLAWINKYEGGMPITNQLLQTEYFQKHYITPHTRAPPYIIGLGFGYCLHQLKGKKVKMGVITNFSGWIVAVVSMVSSVVGCRNFQLENHDYNRLEASVFLSCSRSAWTAGLMWMVWSCVNGYGGIVNDFLSSFIFRVLGRISYGIFLLHMVLLIFKNAANKMPIYFSNFTT
ncbi:nose resistant to fluoxetine protein 6-like, partial [Asbolus verrucosus]